MTRILSAVLLLSGLTGCATRGALNEEIRQRRALAGEVADLRHDALRIGNRLENAFGMLERDLHRKMKQLADLASEWGRPECEHYKPEAPRRFDFERVLAEAARQTDDELCAKLRARGDKTLSRLVCPAQDKFMSGQELDEWDRARGSE